MNTEILKKYIMNQYNWEYIDIDYFNINGANCEIKFYIDKNHHHSETTNINIWGMMMFLLENTYGTRLFV